MGLIGTAFMKLTITQKIFVEGGTFPVLKSVQIWSKMQKLGQNLIYTLQWSKTFTAWIFSKPANVHRQYVGTSCAKFHPDRSICGKYVNKFIYVLQWRMIVIRRTVTTLQLPRRLFVKNAHTQCNKNPTDGLVAVTTWYGDTHKDERMDVVSL